jgi:magnesium-transporting ATPase (P-type)
MACYGLICVVKFLQQRHELPSQNPDSYVTTYIVISIINGLLQLVVASVLIYAVFSIHMIIKKYGLSERVNYRMFFVNAFGMFMYVAAVFVWYGFFYYYAKTYYTHTGLPDYDVPKGKARAIATIAWLCCNIISFLSQLALIAILC